jgi:hypothetical protein
MPIRIMSINSKVGGMMIDTLIFLSLIIALFLFVVIVWISVPMFIYLRKKVERHFDKLYKREVEK